MVIILKIVIVLKDIREERNMSLEELAKRTGISKSHLNYIERNEKEPTISMLCRIAIALNVNERELYKVYR